MSADQYAGFTKGCIVRVKLVNFLTYSNVEFRPGPKLNVVMGPNGTGKSSIVCAIAIGLGASPRVLGRADTLTEFVMTGKDSASTEIELFVGGSATRTITREITKTSRGTSKWKVDGKSATEPQVKKLVEESFNIQIANLCTFLPQEKVGEFSAFDDIGLLRETEKALGGQELLDQHEKLISLEKELQDKSRHESNVKETLDELRDRQRQMEPDKKRQHEREEHLAKVALCDKRILWVEFEEKKDEAIEAKGDKDAEERKLADAHTAVEPFKRSLADVRRAEQAVEREHARRSDVMGKAMSAYNQCKNSHKAPQEHLDELQSTRQNLESKGASLETKARKAAQEVVRKEAELAALSQRAEDPEQAKERAAQLRPRCEAARARESEARERVDESKQSLRAPNQQLQRAKSDLAQLSNVDQQRRERLRQQGGRAAQQCLKLREWIDKNQGSFRREVLGPISLEVSAKTPRDQQVVEACVAVWIWNSFVCQSKADYDQLYKYTNSARGAFSDVGLHTCENPSLNFRRDFKEETMQLLRSNGVEGYVDDLVECAPAVREIVNAHAGLSNILYGGQALEDALARNALEQDLKRDGGATSGYLLVTATRERGSAAAAAHKLMRYQATCSRYCKGDVSTQISSMQPKNLLSAPVDVERVEQARRQLEDATRACEDATREQGVLRTAYDFSILEAKQLSNELGEAQKAVTVLKKAQNELVRLKDKVLDVEREKEAAVAALVRDKAKNSRQLELELLKLTTAFATITSRESALFKATWSNSGLNVTKALVADKKQQCELELREKEHETEALKKLVAVACRRFQQLKDEARALKHRAEQGAPLDEVCGDGASLKDKMAELGDLDAGELQALREAEDEAAGKIISDPVVMMRYNKLTKEISSAEKQCATMATEHEQRTAQMDALKDPWVKTLTDALEQLKRKFGEYMASLKARGDVEIISSRGDDGAPATFDKWGLAIKVAFRDSSDLQKLQAHVQSGGERSVSTIMFLMALQAHMPSPFRVVDEINQGMDETNERIVFKRIVENSTGPKAPQYFLITPKLLQGLTDMNHPDVRALIVFNGPWNVKRPSDWDLDTFQAKKRKLIQQAR